MSDMAIETDGEIEPSEELEIVDTDEASSEAITQPESDEVEIVVEGEEEPASKPTRKSGFYKRLNRLTGQRDDALGEAETERNRAAALEEENRLYRLKLQQLEGTRKEPRPEDFDTDEAYNQEKAKWDQARIDELVNQRVSERLQESESQNTQAQKNRQQEAKLREHYDRAAELNVQDYAETEDVAIDSLGDDLTKSIMATTDKSQVLLYYLGKNPVKAEELRALSLTNPIGCVMEIGRLEEKLKVKPRHSPAPSPDEGVGSGAGAGTISGPPGATFE